MIYSVAAAMLLRRPARRLRTVPSSSVPSMSSRMPPSTAGSTFVLRSMCLPVTKLDNNIYSGCYLLPYRIEWEIL